MHEMQSLAPALVAGLVLGAFFFGGLWWTVRRGLTAAQPALWFAGSLMLRTGVALFGFYVVSGTDWARWLVCLLGFVTARLAVHRLIDRRASHLKRTMRHAS